MKGFEKLYNSMVKQEIDRYKFDFKFHKTNFEVLYFIDEVPHKLAFGVHDHNYYFEVEIRKGFNLTPYIHDYATLRKILGFKYNKDKPFKTSFFFEKLNAYAPKKADIGNVPKPHEVALFRKEVEESTRIYFVGWLDNNKRNNKVTEKNLDKTRQLLSDKAYKLCKEKNISSRWSDKPSDAKEFNIKLLEEEI